MNFSNCNTVHFLFYFFCYVFFFSEAAKTNSRISRRDVVFNAPTYIGRKTESMCNAYTTQACNGALRAQRINVAVAGVGMSSSPGDFSEAADNITNDVHEPARRGRLSRLEKSKQENILEGKSILQENSNETKEIEEIKIQVVGGRLARPKEYPHMALIGYGKYSSVRWSCAGTLISEKFVLSAAHCVSSNEGYPKYIRLGELDLGTTKDDAGTVDYAISQVIVHPGYKPPIQYNDIALFKFLGVYSFTKYIRPICLNIYHNLPNQRTTVVGWGSTGYGEKGSEKLLSVDLNLQPNEQCDLLYRGTGLPYGFNASSQICAGYAPGGKDSCQGDSGGPLQMVNYRAGCTTVPIYKQIGIVSFGESCALADTPAIYTRISFFIPWIESIVWN